MTIFSDAAKNYAYYLREKPVALTRDIEFANSPKESFPTKVASYHVEKDPDGKNLNSPGAKADAGKQLPWLVLGDFSRALEEVIKIGTFGANKYTPHGWLTVEHGQERYMEAFGRHMLAVAKGEIIDEGVGGTGGLHKAQMIWNLLASLELELRKLDEHV